MRISNMVSNRSGKEVANQFEIRDDQGNVYFQSYKTIIAKVDRNGKTVLDKAKWDYSVTTGKYRNHFLGETKAETLKKIKSGEYTLADLN